MEVSPSGYGSGLLIRDSKESREFESHHLRQSVYEKYGFEIQATRYDKKLK